MSKDKVLGLGLAGISLLLALATGIFFLLTGGYVSVAQFTWPALGLLVGAAIFFFGFLEGGLQIDDEIEEFPHLIEDDIEDLRGGMITPTHLFVVVTIMAAVIELGILLWLKKINAFWGSINVMFAALIVVAITLVLSLRSSWFQNRPRRLPPFYFAIPAMGWLICIFAGVSCAEPQERGRAASLERSQAANSQSLPSPGGTYFILNSVGDGLTSFDCDDEGCLLILLVVVVAIAVLASATIPHFWVVATMLLLTLMGMIALRELLYRDDVY